MIMQYRCIIHLDNQIEILIYYAVLFTSNEERIDK